MAAAVQHDSNDPVLHLGVAEALIREGQLLDAKRELLTAVQIDPQFSAGYRELASVMRRLWRPGVIAVRGTYVLIGGEETADSIVMFLRRSFLFDPVEELRPASAYRFPVKWLGVIQPAIDNFHSGQFRYAREELEQALAGIRADAHPDPAVSSVIWYHLLACAALHDFPAAIADGDTLLALARRVEPGDTVNGGERLRGEFEWVQAHLLQQAGRYAEAESLYMRAATANLGNYAAHVELANMYEDQNRWAEAVAERDRALAADVGDGTVEFQAGLTYQEAGLESRADSILRQAIRDNPRETRSYYVLGLADEALQRPEDARSAYDRFLALAPSRYAEMLSDARRRRAALN